MTDATIDPSRFVEDEGLVFEEAAAPPTAKAKRARAPRKGSDPAPAERAAAIADTPLTDAGQEPAAPAAESDPVPPAPTPVPAIATETAVVSAPSALRRYVLPAVMGLSMMSSFASLGGLIAIGRTLADLRAERAHEAETKGGDLTATIARLDRAATALSSAAARPAPAGPLTAGDLRHGLDDLRMALAARQPAGVSALTDQSRSGFSEIATRLDRIEAAVRRPPAARPMR